MVSGVYRYEELLLKATEGGYSGLVLQTVNGESLKITTDGSRLMVIPEGSDPSIAPASVLRKDVETCAGIMHVVDALLAPSGMQVAGVLPLAAASVGALWEPAAVFFPYNLIFARNTDA
jgi:hypothetical protein